MNVPSILMTVGRQFYKLYEYVDEARNDGVSKRIPVTAIPEGMIRGLSKILLAHPDAIVKVTADGKTLADLAYELYLLDLITREQWEELAANLQPFWTGEDLKAGDYVPEQMLTITYALSKVPDKQHSDLIDQFGLEFCMGIFGWSPFTGFQLVLPNDNNDELTDKLAHLQPLIDMGYVEPVHVVYEEDQKDFCVPPWYEVEDDD